jgi:hypothetical protein|tara:strand:+ start:141 stop:626 length:486 start_codon:yes stop_codon:yes gene_type:complete
MEIKQPTYVDFEKDSYHWKPDIDYRKNPHLYKIGRGQQGVLICQPYKSELHPLWKFKTPEIAYESAEKIYFMFNCYLQHDDFVGADMAKKYLHMGFTRSRRYWNHSSGKKWTNNGEWKVLPYDRTEQRFYDSSLIFQKYWKMARTDKKYLEMKKQHRRQHA